MDPGLLKQLMLERSSRTGEMERHAAEVAEYNKIMQRFNNIANKLVKNLNESVVNLKKFQQQCIKGKLAPEIKKIMYSTQLLKQKSPDEIIQSIDAMKSIINKIDAERKDCQEETQDNYNMYTDFSAKEDTLKELSPEKYAEYVDTLQSLRDQLKTALDESMQISLAEVSRAKELIYQYFFQLNELVKEKGYTFNVIQFNAKYGRLKETYFKVFGEQLPVDIDLTMNVSRDEEVALELARQLEGQGYYQY